MSTSWNGKPYHSLDYMLKERFGEKVYKVTLNGGMSCPNRDGTIGHGGCIFCSEGGSGDFAASAALSIHEQIDSQIAMLSAKRPIHKYIAYFQAYTGTYGEMSRLVTCYEEALAHAGVVGLIIGTRPDCMPGELLEYLATLSRRCYMMVEYGIESTLDATLLKINRGHDYACAVDAVRRTAEAGIPVGAHMILGLPGESRGEMLSHAARLSELPLTMVKLHQLQLRRGTRMAREYEREPADFHFYAVDEYIDLAIDFIERLRPDIVVERFVSQSPDTLLIAPRWGLKNHEFSARLLRRMRERGAYQGRLYEKQE